jgi:signal transduction histidine kinase
LHDDLNQRLAMLTVEMERLEKDPNRPADQIRSQLASLRTQTEGISDDVRRTAHRLHPSVVEHLGLPAALRSLCADFSKQEKVQIECRQRNAEGSIPPDVALCIYRVTQEALRNVARHSGARRAFVSLVITPTRVLLSISDTGSGFERESAKTRKGLGIVSMEERVRLVGGTLAIRSKPGAGTRVVAEVPLVEDAAGKKEV